jgi:hypothetical protein
MEKRQKIKDKSIIKYKVDGSKRYRHFDANSYIVCFYLCIYTGDK